MAFIRATGTHRRPRPMSRRAKAAGIAGLTVGVVGSIASPAMAGTGQQARAANGAAGESAPDTAASAQAASAQAVSAQGASPHSAAARSVSMTGDGGRESGESTGLSRAVGFGDSIAETVADQARLQEAAAAQAKAANEAKRRAAAEKAEREREAEEKRERAARAAARAKLNAYVAPLQHASLSTPYQSSSGLWSSGSHTGVDFEADEGTQVRSVASGEVVEAGLDGSFGNSVVVKHRDGTYTQYGHLSSISVAAGQTVKAGQTIALSGSTGNTTGPHLHFEARTGPDYGSDMDPVGYLRKHGVGL